mmetsp:Transcript_33390/g.87931  ORF Transcript_33390/g.87931 Transcript_33390/m.87931 type:complete len:201 (+) Transcript_33390:3059-3661(+)
MNCARAEVDQSSIAEGGGKGGGGGQGKTFSSATSCASTGLITPLSACASGAGTASAPSLIGGSGTSGPFPKSSAASSRSSADADAESEPSATSLSSLPAQPSAPCKSMEARATSGVLNSEVLSARRIATPTATPSRCTAPLSPSLSGGRPSLGALRVRVSARRVSSLSSASLVWSSYGSLGTGAGSWRVVRVSSPPRLAF